MSTQRGKTVARTVKEAKTVHMPSLRRAKKGKKRGWSGSGKGYDTFITVPLVVGDEGYGLLTVDSPVSDSFTENDVVFVELVARLLAMCFAQRAQQL